jgi:hypothetical protein
VATILTIRNEEDAWAVLDQLLDDKRVGLVEFDGWPRLGIKIEGEGYSSSLNTGQMLAFVEFKLVMSRAYCSIAHGSYDARRLKKHEEEQLQLTTTVKKGSSITDTDFTSLVNAFAQIVTQFPQVTLAAAVVISLSLVARPMILKHLENKAKQLDVDERSKLISLLDKSSVEDRRRVQELEKAVQKIDKTYPQFSQALPDASTAFWRLTASAANADKMTISGVELNQTHLETLSERRAQRNAEIEEIDDEFIVLGVVKVQSSYRVQLKSKSLHLSAIYMSPQLTDGKLKKLINCMAGSQTIQARVELKTIDKSQVIGRLLSFRPISLEKQISI